MERKSDLVGDGISEDFFNYIWMKDELGFGPSVNVPDTIVYKYGQPIVWFFTSAASGKVKKKNKSNLISGKIEDAFTRNISGYDVIATFVSAAPTGDTFEGENDGKGSNKNMEFLDREGFHEFLYNRFDQTNGILQKFVEPKGNKNELIRAIWSPKVCLLERSINTRYLHDTGYGLYERCITYEGPEAYSTSAPLRGPVLAGHCQKLTESIAQHISEVTFSQFQIARIVLNFKVDSRDKLWLLYSSSVRCHSLPGLADNDPNPVRSLLNIENTISIPDQIHLNPEKSFDGPAVRKQKIRCVSCAIDCIQDLRHPITYKSVIKHYEHVLQLVIEMVGGRHAHSRSSSKQTMKWPPEQDIIEAAGGVGFGCLALVSPDDPLVCNTKLDLSKPLDQDELRIPPIIRYLHPKLTAKSFERCRKDPLFLYKTVSVCENCYLVYAEFATMLLRIGNDLTKLLRPDPAGITAIHNASMKRPTSAEWRSVSTVQKGGSPERGSKSGLFTMSGSQHEYSAGGEDYAKSANHIQAKVNAIGLRSSNPRAQPDIPGVVRTSEDTRSMHAANDGGMHGSHVMGSTFPDYNHSNVPDNADSIAARERVFYKEVSKNPQTHDQHPLMHLVNAQQKLALIDEQSGVFDTNDSLHSDSLFGSSYGSMAKDEYHSYKQRLPDPRKKKVPSAKLKSISKTRKNGGNTGGAASDSNTLRKSESAEGRVGAASGGGGGIANPSQSSTSHQVFLRETLKKVEGGGSGDNADETPVEPTLRNFKKSNSNKKLPELEREVSFKE
jgi:hypothetical protein